MKRLMKRLINYIDNLTLRTKLVFTYMVLITVPIIFIGWRYYATSTRVISEIVEENTYELVKKNNDIVDAKLSHIVNNITSLITDKDLVNAFNEVDPEDAYSLLLTDNKISNCLNKYFQQSEDIYSVQLATSYFVFGPRSVAQTTVKSLIPKDSFMSSSIYSIAKKQNGKIQWIPTYDFGEMFNIPYLENVEVDYKYMFSAVVEVKGIYYENGAISKISDDIEKPFLIINFKEDFFQQVYKDSFPTEGSYFFVITKDGQIVSHQNRDMIAKTVSLPWLDDLVREKSGGSLVEINGRKMIACYSTSKITGWISVVVIPPEGLVRPIVPIIRSYTVYAAILLTFISLLVASFLSIKITDPISKLTKAIKKTGEGNFDLKMKEEGGREAKELIHRFNVMNEKIQKLIKENYEIKIKEKDAEITALNLQLDPHFMYNTLNLINLIAIENGQDEISEMLLSLSKMLKYTVKSGANTLVKFKMDMEYLQSYIFIMTKRFEGKFVVEYDIDPELYECSVPKFFLQPFVENSLIHGFDSLKSLGVLKITCRKDGDKGLFCIEDNGRGIDPERIAQITDPERGSIGISNIIKRIKIMFGSEYGVNIESALGVGTKVTVSIPVTNE